jgi:release factor glutamine methyltransferase
MTSREALLVTRQTLAAAGFDDANVESTLLLGHILGISETELYSEPERILTPSEIKELELLTSRRLHHEPLAYIVGHCQFYGHDFHLTRHTFIPRPETEFLVEEAVNFARRHHPENQLTLADIGTGSGAVAISLALALPEARIYATEIDTQALKTARINCRQHGVSRRVILLQGNLLEPLPGPVNVIIANLPYVKNNELEKLDPEIANFEPRIALAGGEDGLDIVRRLLTQVQGRLHPDGCLLLEIGYTQSKAVNSLLVRHLPRANIKMIADLAGIERVARITL